MTPEEWLKSKGFVQQSNPRHYRMKVPGFNGLINVFLHEENGQYIWETADIIYTLNSVYTDLMRTELKSGVSRAHKVITGTELPQ